LGKNRFVLNFGLKFLILPACLTIFLADLFSSLRYLRIGRMLTQRLDFNAIGSRLALFFKEKKKRRIEMNNEITKETKVKVDLSTKGTIPEEFFPLLPLSVCSACGCGTYGFFFDEEICAKCPEKTW